MKAVILAAGEGRRMRPLTLDTPKPLLKINSKAILDHIVERFSSEIDELIIVVNYLGDKIKEYCGNEFHGRKVSYSQGSDKGNAIGFCATKKLFDPGERFLILYGDEILSKKEINDCFEHEFSWLCYKVDRETAKRSGVAVVDEKGVISEMIEKPKDPPSLVAVNSFIITNTDIFDYDPVQHENGEYHVSDMMNSFLKKNDVYAVMGSEEHMQITCPADLEVVAEKLRNSII
jgi:NDP-sugar pyrophosphorylase family protein